MKKLILMIMVGNLLMFTSCSPSKTDKTQSVVASVTNPVPTSVVQSTNEFKDVVKILKTNGIKYQIIKSNKEIKIPVTATVNSKFSDWTASKVYAYLSGDNFDIVSSAINNNSDGDFHYETKNIKFNVVNQTMSGGTYVITNNF